jgi:hypothetical protein
LLALLQQDFVLTRLNVYGGSRAKSANKGEIKGFAGSLSPA